MSKVNVKYFSSFTNSDKNPYNMEILDGYDKQLESNLEGGDYDYETEVIDSCQGYYDPAKGGGGMVPLSGSNEPSNSTPADPGDKNIYLSHSNGHHAMFAQARADLENSNQNVPTILVSYEGMTSNDTSIENMQYCAEHGIPLVYATRGNLSGYVDDSTNYVLSEYQTKHYLEAGGTVYLVQTEKGNHGEGDNSYIKNELDNNFVGALVGNGDVKNPDEYKLIYKCYIDPNTGQLVKEQIKDFDELKENLDRDSLIAAGFDPDNIDQIGNTPLPNLKEAYGDNLSDFSNNYRFNDNTLASDLSLIYRNTESILGKTNTVDLKTYSGTGIVRNMNEAQNYFSGVSNQLMGTISGEMKAIQNIADAIFRMDTESAYIGQEVLNEDMKNFLNGVNYSESDLATIRSYGTSLGSGLNDYMNGCEYLKNDTFRSFNNDAQIGMTSMSMLDSAMNSSVNFFENEKSKAHDINSLVNEFSSCIGGNNKLSGGIFDDIKGNLNAIGDVSKLMENSSSILENAFKAGIQMVRESIAPDESIDANRLEPARTELANAKSQLNQAKATMNSLRASLQHMQANKKRKDENGNEVGSFSDADISRVQGMIQQCQTTIDRCEADIQELEEEITKIENYKAAVEQAQQLINDAIDTVQSTLGQAATNLNQYGNVNNPNVQEKIDLDFSTFDMSQYSGYIQRFDDYYNATQRGETPTVQHTNFLGNTDVVSGIEPQRQDGIFSALEDKMVTQESISQNYFSTHPREVIESSEVKVPESNSESDAKLQNISTKEMERIEREQFDNSPEGQKLASLTKEEREAFDKMTTDEQAEFLSGKTFDPSAYVKDNKTSENITPLLNKETTSEQTQPPIFSGEEDKEMVARTRETSPVSTKDNPMTPLKDNEGIEVLNNNGKINETRGNSDSSAFFQMEKDRQNQSSGSMTPLSSEGETQNQTQPPIFLGEEDKEMVARTRETSPVLTKDNPMTPLKDNEGIEVLNNNGKINETRGNSDSSAFFQMEKDRQNQSSGSMTPLSSGSANNTPRVSNSTPVQSDTAKRDSSAYFQAQYDRENGNTSKIVTNSQPTTSPSTSSGFKTPTTGNIGSNYQTPTTSSSTGNSGNTNYGNNPTTSNYNVPSNNTPTQNTNNEIPVTNPQNDNTPVNTPEVNTPQVNQETTPVPSTNVPPKGDIVINEPTINPEPTNNEVPPVINNSEENIINSNTNNTQTSNETVPTNVNQNVENNTPTSSNVSNNTQSNNTPVVNNSNNNSGSRPTINNSNGGYKIPSNYSQNKETNYEIPSVPIQDNNIDDNNLNQNNIIDSNIDSGIIPNENESLGIPPIDVEPELNPSDVTIPNTTYDENEFIIDPGELTTPQVDTPVMSTNENATPVDITPQMEPKNNSNIAGTLIKGAGIVAGLAAVGVGAKTAYDSIKKEEKEEEKEEYA